MLGIWNSNVRIKERCFTAEFVSQVSIIPMWSNCFVFFFFFCKWKKSCKDLVKNNFQSCLPDINFLCQGSAYNLKKNIKWFRNGGLKDHHLEEPELCPATSLCHPKSIPLISLSNWIHSQRPTLCYVHFHSNAQSKDCTFQVGFLESYYLLRDCWWQINTGWPSDPGCASSGVWIKCIQ